MLLQISVFCGALLSCRALWGMITEQCYTPTYRSCLCMLVRGFFIKPGYALAMVLHKQPEDFFNGRACMHNGTSRGRPRVYVNSIRKYGRKRIYTFSIKNIFYSSSSSFDSSINILFFYFFFIHYYVCLPFSLYSPAYH